MFKTKKEADDALRKWYESMDDYNFIVSLKHTQKKLKLLLTMAKERGLNHSPTLPGR